MAEKSQQPQAPQESTQEQDINPFSVAGATNDAGEAIAIDYDALSKKWNTSKIDDALLERFEKVTGHKPHRWLRRGLFFSHRDFEKILDKYDRGEDFFLYTGRGPSSGSLHIGHTIPMLFTKWLQDVFDVPLVFMLTDDEKTFLRDMTRQEAYLFGQQNAKDIIALGFDMKKTFIFSDLAVMGDDFYGNVVDMMKLLPNNQVRGAFGFDGSTNVGMNGFPAVQGVPALATTFPFLWNDNYEYDPGAKPSKALAKISCLIPMGIDQDPYFRLIRDNVHRLKPPSPKPAIIHSKFLTALQGAGGKMSSSEPNSAIFMTDTPNQIKKKINKYAFSGGQETLEMQRELGGDPDVDVSYIYLTYFEEDDAKLKKVYEDYKKGTLSTGELKQMAIAALTEEVTRFQENRAQVTDEILKSFQARRKLEWKGNAKVKAKAAKDDKDQKELPIQTK